MPTKSASSLVGPNHVYFIALAMRGQKTFTLLINKTFPWLDQMCSIRREVYYISNSIFSNGPPFPFFFWFGHGHCNYQPKAAVVFRIAESITHGLKFIMGLKYNSFRLSDLCDRKLQRCLPEHFELDSFRFCFESWETLGREVILGLGSRMTMNNRCNPFVFDYRVCIFKIICV